MNINELSEKIEILETRQAFQEDTIDSLNDVIIKQQKDIEQLALKYNNLQEKLARSSESNISTEVEQPPPHY